VDKIREIDYFGDVVKKMSFPLCSKKTSDTFYNRLEPCSEFHFTYRSSSATHRQSLTGILSRHELNLHGDVPHGALTAAEVQTLWVNIEQVPERQKGCKAEDEREREREKKDDKDRI